MNHHHLLSMSVGILILINPLQGHTIDKLGTIYVGGLRRLARINYVLEVYNLPCAKSVMEYGIAANTAVMTEVKQMTDKGVFKIMSYTHCCRLLHIESLSDCVLTGMCKFFN